jgi:methyl-accepting chemotaxis protein
MSQPHQPRKQFLVEPSIQMPLMVSVLGTVVAFSALYLATILILGADGSTLDDPSSRAATRLGVAVTGAYFLLVLVAVAVVVIRMTHRFAGPARVLERAVRAMLEGDFGQRMAVRSKDMLRSLSAALLEVQTRWSREREQLAEFRGRLAEALEKGDLEAARALEREFRPETSETADRQAA